MIKCRLHKHNNPDQNQKHDNRFSVTASVQKSHKVILLSLHQNTAVCCWKNKHFHYYHKLVTRRITHTQTHTTFNGPFSRTTRVSRYQKGKTQPIWILLKQETVSGSGISWAIYKSASRSRQITTPVPHHSVFYRPDALPAAQPTASKHYSQNHLHKKLYPY